MSERWLLFNYLISLSKKTAQSVDLWLPYFTVNQHKKKFMWDMNLIKGYHCHNCIDYVCGNKICVSLNRTADVNLSL